VLAAGEHLLWRFRATGDIAALEGAIQILRFAVGHADNDAERSIANCRLGETLTCRAIRIIEGRYVDSDRAAACARAARTQANNDAALQIQADFALGEALTSPFGQSSDPTTGLGGIVLPPAGNTLAAGRAFEGAAKNPTAQFQRLAIIGAVYWSEIALEFFGWPETADAMRHALVAFERFLAHRPCRVEVFQRIAVSLGSHATSRVCRCCRGGLRGDHSNHRTRARHLTSLATKPPKVGRMD